MFILLTFNSQRMHHSDIHADASFIHICARSFAFSSFLMSRIWRFDSSLSSSLKTLHCRCRHHVSSLSLLNIYFSLLFKFNWTRFFFAFNNFPFIVLLFWVSFYIHHSRSLSLSPSLSHFIMIFKDKMKRINSISFSRSIFSSRINCFFISVI